VGRRRRISWIKGCPILASLFEREAGWLQGGSTSFVIATRHEQPCPCTVAFCSPLVPRCDQPATVPRPPNMCRTESHRHSSRPVVPPSRAACRRLTVRMWLDRRLIGNAPSGSRRTSHESQVAANSDPQPRQSPRQPLHFVPAVVTGFASTPDPKKVFGGRQGPEPRRALPAAEACVYEPPAAPHCREARERACLRGERNGWGRRKILESPSR
jgi:hypothetical protein